MLKFILDVEVSSGERSSMVLCPFAFTALSPTPTACVSNRQRKCKLACAGLDYRGESEIDIAVQPPNCPNPLEPHFPYGLVKVRRSAPAWRRNKQMLRIGKK